MKRRQLEFRELGEVIEEVERLRRSGYRPAGRWNLTQVCDHLSYFIGGSLDGFSFRVPWLFKVLFGRLVVRRILKQRRMKTGVPTPQKPLPPPGGDEAAVVGRLKQLVERFQSSTGELCPSPFFGALTRQPWSASPAALQG